MHLRKASFLCWSITLFFFCLGTGSAQAQTKQPDDDQTIQSLLNEVRLLRRTLQQTGLNAHRSQIIIERMRAHADQVVRLTRSLVEARNDVEKVEATIPYFMEQAKLMEGQIEREMDVTKRAQLEFEVREKKRAVERYKTGLERQRAREQQVSMQLAAEQAKLADLENRLDVLEREIENEVERQRTEDRSHQGRKRP